MVQFHNDEPALVDLQEVGCAPLVERIGKAVVGAKPPQVFGVHGEWGAGKTSFLLQLHYYLTGSCPQATQEPDPTAHAGAAGGLKDSVTVVWFEAWRYQHEAVPIVALLHEIRTQLPWAAKALGESKKLLEVAIRGALLSLEDLTKTIGFQASKIEQAGREWEEQHLATRLPSHVIRQQLDHAMTTLLGGADDHRLVVLIDDLDRCDAQCAYRLLEGIKIYLNLPSCVFVLAMNQRIVEQAVAQQLPNSSSADDGTTRRRAKEYLEKLCSSVYHLPLIRKPSLLLDAYLKQAGYPGGAQMWREVCAIVSEYDCLPRIPRKIKSYAGLLLRFHDRLEAARNAAQNRTPHDPNRWAETAVVFTYLYHFEPELYRHLWADRDYFSRVLLPWAAQRSGSEEETLAGITYQSRLRRHAGTGQEPVAEQEPTEKAFVDPAADDVLHVQELIAKVGRITTDEHEENLLG